MFSQTAEYALRAAVWLASRGDAPQTTQQIAKATKAPSGYLSKVLQSMARSGLVQAQRGLNGGFSLAQGPDSITVLDVVNAVDPIQRIRTCPLDLKGHGIRLCPLHRRLDDAMSSIEQAFAATSLADLLAEPTESRPLCDSMVAVAEVTQ